MLTYYYLRAKYFIYLKKYHFIWVLTSNKRTCDVKKYVDDYNITYFLKLCLLNTAHVFFIQIFIIFNS